MLLAEGMVLMCSTQFERMQQPYNSTIALIGFNMVYYYILCPYVLASFLCVSTDNTLSISVSDCM